MELQTERLRIVPCTEELLSTISTEEYKIGLHIKMYLEKFRGDSTQLGWGVWLVFNKENNTIIGDIGFKGKPNSENTVEVGYGMIPSAQNKGFATKAVNEIINWAFTNDDVDKVVAECLQDNIPSIKVLEKLNMSKIGTVNDMLKWELKREDRDHIV